MKTVTMPTLFDADNLHMNQRLAIGIAGSGFIARGFLMAIERLWAVGNAAYDVKSVLTRREPELCFDFPRKDLLTNSLNQFIDECQVIVECSGDVLHATNVIDAALKAGRIVVTMDAEFHVTTGSYFAGKGSLTEAQGDQPGSLAALAEDVAAMGFQPWVYGNRKGYYHPNPPRDQMEFWAKKQGLSLDQVTAATDGTKIQIEQALVANGLGADIVQDGLLGPTAETLHEGGLTLALHAKGLGRPIADYVIAAKAPAGIFIVAEHDPRQQPYLEYLKLGEGPFYTLVHNYHLCHLEIVKTIQRMIEGRGPLLDNSARPRFGVAAVAKRDLKVGEVIRRGIGSFDLRGEAVRLAAHRGHVPIGLVSDVVIQRPIQAGQRLNLDDIEIPDSLAWTAWQKIGEALGKERP
jgi:predicted homoserine dehydrogenase-like protein